MNATRSRLIASVLLLASAIAGAAAMAQESGSSQTQPDAAAEKTAYVLLTTSKGDILLELNAEKAPITVANFLNYVEKGHYEGTIFHRVISSFMIQGGGFTADNKQKPTDKPIKLESDNGLSNTLGTVAMARTGVPDSATSQFFINVVDNSKKLDATMPRSGYAVFGKVVAGMDTVEKIRNIPVVPDQRGEPSKPTETVTIDKARKLTAEEAQKLIDAAKGSAQPQN